MNVDSLRGRFWQCTLPTCQKRPRRWKAKTTAWVGWSVELEAALGLSLDTGIVHADVGVICVLSIRYLSAGIPLEERPRKRARKAVHVDQVTCHQVTVVVRCSPWFTGW